MVKMDMKHITMEWPKPGRQQSEGQYQATRRINSYPPSMTIPRPFVRRPSYEGSHSKPQTRPTTFPQERDAGRDKGEPLRPTKLQLGKNIGRSNNEPLSRSDVSRHSTGSMATGKKELSVFTQPKPVTAKTTALKPILKSGKGTYDNKTSDYGTSYATSDFFKRRLGVPLDSRPDTEPSSRLAISPTADAKKSVTFKDDKQTQSELAKYIRRQTLLPFVSLSKTTRRPDTLEGQQIFV